MIRLLRRCHLPLLLLLSFAQLLVLILSRLAPQAGDSLVRMGVLCLPLLMLCAASPGRMRAAVLTACCLALFGAGAITLSGAVMYAAPALFAVLLFVSLFHAGKNPSQASPVFYFACVFAQLISLFLLYHGGGAVSSLSLMQGAFYLWLLLFLLAFNRISLNNATLSRYRLSEGMARTGAALTVCVFFLALLLRAMPAVVSGIIWLARALRDGTVWLLLFLINLFPTESTGGSMGGGMPLPPQMGMPAAEEPSLFAVILERLAAVFSFVVLIVGGAVLLRYLVRALVRLMHHLLLRLQRYAAAVTEDYEDEITDTRTEESERSFQTLRRRRARRQAYSDTPAGHIRRRYAQLLVRHSAWKASSTARENLPPSAASVYERARYSNHALTPEDAQRFEQETQ